MPRLQFKTGLESGRQHSARGPEGAAPDLRGFKDSHTCARTRQRPGAGQSDRAAPNDQGAIGKVLG